MKVWECTSCNCIVFVVIVFGGVVPNVHFHLNHKIISQRIRRKNHCPKNRFDWFVVKKGMIFPVNWFSVLIKFSVDRFLKYSPFLEDLINCQCVNVAKIVKIISININRLNYLSLDLWLQNRMKTWHVPELMSMKQ